MLKKCMMIFISSLFLFTGALGLTAKEVSAAVYGEEQTIPESEDLWVKIRSKTSSAEVGSTVKFNAESTGGVGTVKYKYRYKMEGGEWTTFRNYSMVDLAKLRPDTAGMYRVIVYARDTATGKISSSARKLIVTQHTGKELSINTVFQNKNPSADEEFKVYALAGGGVRYYRYSYSYIDSNGKRTNVSKLTYDSNAVFKIHTPGKYTVVVGVTDAESNYIERKTTINVCEKSTKPLSAESEISSDKIVLGEKISVNISADGGSRPYRYSFSYVNAEGSTVNVSSGTAGNAEINFTRSGYYTVKAEVYDSENNCVKKEYPVVVYEDTQRPLSVSGFLSASKISAGNSIKLTAAVSGGVRPYLYKFSYIDEDGKTVSLDEFDTPLSAGITIPNSGFYKVVVSAKDYSGMISEKAFNVCVTKDTGKSFSAEINNDMFIKEGNTAEFSVSASGGTEPYEYRFSYRKPNGQWAVFKDYSTSATAGITASEKGYLYVKAEIRDGSGKVYSEESNISVYSKNTTSTIARTSLQELPKWASKSLSDIPEGGLVNIITQNGHWFCVYYRGNVGWVYNRALGNYTNYTTVNTTTLPDIADDIIFERGKDPFLLFRYVTGMAYRAMEKDSIENMCVELIKYKRGACYQRAAMVYYLYLRAGFDAIRVSDGIDDYTGGGPHNWVIVKTKEGYRHVDPTQVIGLPEFYMVTDNDISPYFSWDRKKYPACK